MWSILLATVVSIVIGGLWFSPKVFYPVYEREMGLPEQLKQTIKARFKPAVHFGIVFIAEFTLATMIYGLLEITNGDMRVLLFPILFVVVSNIKTNVFSFLNFKLFVIAEGEKVVSIIAMGAIIGLMM